MQIKLNILILIFFFRILTSYKITVKNQTLKIEVNDGARSKAKFSDTIMMNNIWYNLQVKTIV